MKSSSLFHASIVPLALAIASQSAAAWPQQTNPTTGGPQSPREACPTSGPPFVLNIAATPRLIVPALKDDPPGYTVERDPVTGELHSVKQLLQIPLPLPFSGWNAVSCSLGYYESYSFESSSVGLSASSGFEYTSFLTEVAVTGGLQVSTTDSALTESFRVMFEAVYPDEELPASLPSSALTPEACTVLSIVDPVARTNAWHAAGFGDYVIIGRRPAGRLGIECYLSQNASDASKSYFISLKAQYATVSGYVQFAQMYEQLRNQSAVAFHIYGEGIDVSQMQFPPLASNPTPDQLMAFANSFATLAKTARTSEAAIVIDAKALSYGPDTNLPILGGSTFDQATITLRNAILQFDAVSLIKNSLSKNYLVHHLDADLVPGGPSFGDIMDQDVATLTAALHQLQQAIVNYSQGQNAENPVYTAQVNQARAVTDAAVSALADLFAQYPTLLQANVPAMQIAATGNRGPIPAPCLYSNYPITFTITVSNCALFPRLSPQDPIGTADITAYFSSATITPTPLTVFETAVDPTFPQVNNQAETFATQSLYNLQMNQIVRDPATGLYTVTFDVTDSLVHDTPVVDIKVFDQTGRPKMLHLPLQ